MKKGMLFSIALLAGFSVFSQDYQCIKDDADYFFWDGWMYHAIAIDSVQVHPDFTSYYNFTVVGKDDYQTECYTKDWPSWFGPRTDIYTNGDHFFFNYMIEPILIKTMKNAGDSWVSYNFSDGRFIESTIYQKVQMEFLGITDSVKKITFQVKDQNGIPISHSINDKQIWISKNHGLVKAINFKLFPDLYDYFDYYVEESDLSGISNPQVGVQNLTAREIYNYDIGDEFHIWDLTWGGGSATDFKRILTITGKEWIGDSIVIYTKKRCERKRYFGSWDTLLLFNDTVTEIFNFNDSYWLALDEIPEKYSTMGDSSYHDYFWTMETFNEEINKRCKSLISGYFSFYPHDCIYEIITSTPVNYKDNGFTGGWADGLGGYWNDDQGGVGNISGLVYFKKGEEEWGTPFNCDSLLTGLTITTIDAKTSVHPNPMHDWAKLTVDNPENKEYQFQLFNLMGVLLREYRFQTNDLMIQRENLGNGIYFYLLSDGQKVKQSGKLIIQ